MAYVVLSWKPPEVGSGLSFATPSLIYISWVFMTSGISQRSPDLREIFTSTSTASLAWYAIIICLAFGRKTTFWTNMFPMIGSTINTFTELPDYLVWFLKIRLALNVGYLSLYNLGYSCTSLGCISSKFHVRVSRTKISHFFHVYCTQTCYILLNYTLKVETRFFQTKHPKPVNSVPNPVQVRTLSALTSAPLICDGDTGFGGLLNVSCLADWWEW